MCSSLPRGAAFRRLRGLGMQGEQFLARVRGEGVVGLRGVAIGAQSTAPRLDGRESLAAHHLVAGGDPELGRLGPPSGRRRRAPSSSPRGSRPGRRPRPPRRRRTWTAMTAPGIGGDDLAIRRRGRPRQRPCPVDVGGGASRNATLRPATSTCDDVADARPRRAAPIPSATPSTRRSLDAVGLEPNARRGVDAPSRPRRRRSARVLPARTPSGRRPTPRRGSRARSAQSSGGQIRSSVSVRACPVADRPAGAPASAGTAGS